MLKNKHLAPLILSAGSRCTGVRSFLSTIGFPVSKLEVAELRDAFGPPAYCPEYRCIVASAESVPVDHVPPNAPVVLSSNDAVCLFRIGLHNILFSFSPRPTSVPAELDESKLSSSTNRFRLLGTLLRPVNLMTDTANRDPDAPYVIGLAGPSGAGKSALARRLAQLSKRVHVIDCDRLGHEAYRSDRLRYRMFDLGQISLESTVFPTDLTCVWIAVLPRQEAQRRICERANLDPETANERLLRQAAAVAEATGGLDWWDVGQIDTGLGPLGHAHVALSTQWEPECSQLQVCKAFRALEKRLTSVQPGTACHKALIDHFGLNAIASPEPPHPIDRIRLGKLVFSDAARLQELNAIVWPEIERLVVEKLEQLHPNTAHLERDSTTRPIVILDAAVLLPAGWNKICHEVWIAVLPRQEAQRRICERANLDPETANERLLRQAAAVAEATGGLIGGMLDK
ncbi:hypothetical protein AHF37_06982 [Paragonimus kellicotti]|nr:hypothetical protein AHF37_06982 [Paragonimus kellicotti]